MARCDRPGDTFPAPCSRASVYHPDADLKPIDVTPPIENRLGFNNTQDQAWGQFGFTAAEANIARLVAMGTPNKTIARRLVVQLATVKWHVRTILKKTGASNRTEAALILRDGL